MASCVNGKQEEEEEEAEAPVVGGQSVFHAMNDDNYDNNEKGGGDVEMAKDQTNENDRRGNNNNNSSSNSSSIRSNNNETNQHMTLLDAQVELERQGLSCEYESANLLVGVMSECRWTLQSKMDVMVFVHQVDGILTLERMVNDRQALPNLVKDHYVGGCPPFGFARALMIIIVYYAQSIEPPAIAKLRQVPNGEWCQTTFLAAQDSTGRSFFMEHDTPYWGAAFYPELRFRAGRLTGRPLDGPVPGVPRWIWLVNGFSLFYVLHLLSWSETRYTLWYMLVSVFVLFLIAALVQWYRRSTTTRATGRNGQHHVLLAQY